METGSVSSKPGRPRVLLRINPNGAAAAGVWLSEDAIRIGLASPDGEILSRETISYESCGDSLETAITVIADGIPAMRRAGRQAG